MKDQSDDPSHHERTHIQDSTYHMEQWLEREVNGERERQDDLLDGTVRVVDVIQEGYQGAAADIQDSTYHMEQWLEREVNGERERQGDLLDGTVRVVDVVQEGYQGALGTVFGRGRHTG